MREKPLILLVDDDPDFLEIVSTKLRASGFDVALAHNEKEAIRESLKLPDLILMDIHMPGGSGTDAALAIKQNSATKDIKIAFLTSMQEPWPAMTGDNKKISEELGMQDFLNKTDDLDVLVDQVQGLLNRSTAS